MKKIMKPDQSFYSVTKIYGIVVTSLMLLIFGGTIIQQLIEKGIGELGKYPKACLHWYDDPTGFFFTYLIGYALVWWKPLPGGMIIVAGGILEIIINIDNTGFLIFAAPTLLVGVFYILIFFSDKRKK
jgi:hypothetical protein